MAYTIRKKNRIKEELQLCYASGEPALILYIDLDTYKILPKFNKLKEQLGIALVELQKNPEAEDAKETVGKAILSFFNLIFGENQTKEMMEFYNGNESEALADVYTFLCEAVFPDIEKAQSEIKNKIIEFAKSLKGV